MFLRTSHRYQFDRIEIFPHTPDVPPLDVAVAGPGEELCSSLSDPLEGVDSVGVADLEL